MKTITITSLIALIACIVWCFVLREQNHSLKQKRTPAQIDAYQQPYVALLAEHSRVVDSFKNEKQKTAIKWHEKIIEKKIIVEVEKSDSSYIPIFFNPEYQLLACMYDSLYSDKEFTEKILFATHEQLSYFGRKTDSLSIELKKYHRFIFSLYFKK